MEIPFGNIFEVTINTNKLYAYIEDILSQLRDHNHKINHLNQTIGGITTSFNEKIKMNDYNMDIQLQKMRKANQEQINYVRLFMRDVDKKANDKISEMESTLTFLNSKMIKVKETIEDDIAYKLSYIDKRLTSITTLQEDQERTNQQIIKLRESIFETNFKIEKVSANIEDQAKKNFQMNDSLLQRISQLEKKIKFQNEIIEPMKHSIVEDKSQSKSKKRKEKQEQRQSQIFSNIINKIEQVEHNLSKEIENKSNLHQPRRSMVSNSKVVKSNTDIINQLPKSGFSIKNGGKFKEFQSLVMEKLQKLQSLSIQKFGFFERQINKVTNKNDIIDEHIGILSRKIDKEKFKITQVAENMKRFDDKRIDQRTIENLKNMIKKLSKDTEEILETKLTKEVYQKQKQKNIEKMQFMNQFIIEKAEKSQVKKGLAFLEQKIKEIIIVLAEERGSGQDGAMKKTPYKCLSCDKDLQIDRQDIQGRITPKQNLANITRCNTNQLRKRIRMINNTITTNQNDD